MKAVSFQVGDPARIVGDSQGGLERFQNQFGEITSFHGGGICVVRLDDGATVRVPLDDLRLAVS